MMSKYFALVLTGFLGGGLLQSRGDAPTLYYGLVFGALAMLTVVAALIWGKP